MINVDKITNAFVEHFCKRSKGSLHLCTVCYYFHTCDEVWTYWTMFSFFCAQGLLISLTFLCYLY